MAHDASTAGATGAGRGASGGTARRTPRSLLFAPGSDERKLTGALRGRASLAVADLEDAVTESEKDSARETVRRVLADRSGHVRCAIRINALPTAQAPADVDLARKSNVDALVVPKAELDHLEAFSRDAPAPLLAIVETPAGLQQAAEIARLPNVWALMLGGVDLGRSLRWLPRADGLELLFARSKLVMDSAAAGIAAPIDVVHTDLDSLETLDAQARLARSLGFGGKACIHPNQIEPVEIAFSASAAEIAAAQRIVTEYEHASAQGNGAVRVGGEMIDLPVYQRALELINEGES